MKQVIRLTESDLHKVIKESVKRVLRETSFNTAAEAWKASMDDSRPQSAAFQRRLAKNPHAAIERDFNFKNGVNNAFNREFGYNLKNVPYGSDEDNTALDVDDKTKPYHVGGMLYAPYGTLVGNKMEVMKSGRNGKYTPTLASNNRYVRLNKDGINNDQEVQDDLSANNKKLSPATVLRNPEAAKKYLQGQQAINRVFPKNN